MDTKYKFLIALQNIGIYVLVLGAAWLTTFMFPTTQQVINDKIVLVIGGFVAIILNDFFGYKRFAKAFSQFAGEPEPEVPEEEQKPEGD